MTDNRSSPDIVERLRAWPAAYGDEDGLSSTYVGKWTKTAADNIDGLRVALAECLSTMGWANYTDDEIRREAELGNGKAAVILRARASRMPATPTAGERWLPISTAPDSIQRFAKDCEAADDRNGFIEFGGSVAGGLPFVLCRANASEKIFDRWFILPSVEPATEGDAVAGETRFDKLERDFILDGVLIEHLKKQLEDMRKALEPFANIAPFVEFTDFRDGNIVHRQRDRDGTRHELTKDHFRKAATTFAALRSPDAAATTRDLTDDQIMDVLRKVTKDDLRAMLTCKRWKDGIDIDSPTFAAQWLAQEFRAVGAAQAANDLIEVMDVVQTVFAGLHPDDDVRAILEPIVKKFGCSVSSTEGK